MRLPDTNLRLQILFAAFFCAAMPLRAAETTAVQSAPANAAPPPSRAAITNAGAMDVPVPVGEPVKGIKIPQYDEQGKLTMNLTAETALKLDERKVEFNNLRIQFADKEEKEIIVEIPHSILDLDTRLLVADTKTVIRREDFDIAGDKAEFDTVARTGTFKGPVRASFRNGAPTDQP